MSKADLSNIISGVGVAILLLAFVLNTTRVVTNMSRTYYVLNVGGALIAGTGAVIIVFWPFIVMEAMWTVVGAIGLARTFGSDKQR